MHVLKEKLPSPFFWFDSILGFPGHSSLHLEKGDGRRGGGKSYLCGYNPQQQVTQISVEASWGRRGYLVSKARSRLHQQFPLGPQLRARAVGSCRARCAIVEVPNQG